MVLGANADHREGAYLSIGREYPTSSGTRRGSKISPLRPSTRARPGRLTYNGIPRQVTQKVTRFWWWEASLELTLSADEGAAGCVLAGTARTHARHHDYPDLPNALMEIAAGAVQTIRQAANEAATGKLPALRGSPLRGQRPPTPSVTLPRTKPRRHRTKWPQSAQLAEAPQAQATSQARLIRAAP